MMKNVHIGWGPVGMDRIKPDSQPKLKLNKNNFTGEPNSEFQLLIVSGATESPIWQSSNESVAIVDLDGNVTLVGEGTAIITVTSGKLVGRCTIKVVLSKELQFIKDMQLGGNVKLTSNITLSAPVQIRNTVVLDLNGHDIIMSAEGLDAIWVLTGGNLTINGEGNIVGTYYSLYAGGDAKVEINGGNFVGVAAAIYAQSTAVVEINDGRYEAYNDDPKYGPHDYTLNLKDNSNAKILVKGGQFYKFNPADNKAEGPNTNFVVEGYESVEVEPNVWEVRKIKSIIDETKIYYGTITPNLETFTGYSDFTEQDLIKAINNGTMLSVDNNAQQNLVVALTEFQALTIFIPKSSSLKAFKSELGNEFVFNESNTGLNFHSNGEVTVGNFKVFGELITVLGFNANFIINIHE